MRPWRNAVPEVFVDYLRALNASPNPNAPVSDDAFIRAAQSVATVSLGKTSCRKISCPRRQLKR